MLRRFGNYVYSSYYESLSGLSREVWIMSLLMLITRSGLMVMPFLSIYLTEELDFSIYQAGIATMCFGIGSITSALLGGYLTDRFGHIRVMQFSLLAGGMSFWTLLTADTFYEFCGLIMLTALLADLLRPAVMSSISSYSKEANRTRAISLLRMAINFGIAVGPAVGGLLIKYFDYQWLFIINGGMMIVSFVFFTLVKGGMKEYKSTLAEEKEIVPSKFKNAYSDFYHWYLLVIMILLVAAFLQIIFAIPLFFKQVYMMSEAQVGLFFTINGLMIFFLEMPIVNFFEKRRWFYKPIIYGGLLMTMAFLALLIPVGTGILTWILPFTLYTLFIGVGEILNLPFFNSLSLARSDKSNSGSYMGLFSLVFSVSITILGTVGGYIIANHGYNALWIFCAGLCLISTAMFHFSRKEFLISDKYL